MKRTNRNIRAGILSVLLSAVLLIPFPGSSAAALEEQETEPLPDGITTELSAEGTKPVLEETSGSSPEETAEAPAEETNDPIPEESTELPPEETTEPVPEQSVEPLPGETPEAITEETGALLPEDSLAEEDIPTPLLLGDIPQDASFLSVRKTFSGISAEQIPADFSVTVVGAGSSYTLVPANADSSSGTEFIWKIYGPGLGTYTVTEQNAEIPGFILNSSGTGTVEVTAATLATDIYRETTCSKKNWPVSLIGSRSTIFAAALTGSGCIVVSEQSLSASERAAIANAVVGIGGNWKNPVEFFSIDVNGNGPWEIHGKRMEYHPETDEIWLYRTSDWTHVATVGFNLIPGVSDIGITNQYIPQVAAPTMRSAMIEKVVTGDMGDRNKAFAFAVTCSEPMTEGDGYLLSEDGLTAEFSLKHGESVILAGLHAGAELTVTERNAEGYRVTVTVAGAECPDGTFTVPEEGHGTFRVTVTNTKNAIPDTGITANNLPYVFLVTVVLVWAFLMFLEERRK